MDAADRLTAESLRLLGHIASLEARIHALEAIAQTTGEAVAAAAALLDTLTDAVKRHIDIERTLAAFPPRHWAGVDEDGYPHFDATSVSQALRCECVHCRKKRALDAERRARRDADV